MLKQTGFSLVELLIIIAIISILSLQAVLTYSNIQRNARDSKRRADVDEIGKAIELRFNTQINQYCPAPVGTYCKPESTWFLGNIPTDPFGVPYQGVAEMKDGDKSFMISAKLESGSIIYHSNQQ